VARGGTTILAHSRLSLAAIDRHCVGLYTVILLPLLSLSARMTAPPLANDRSPQVVVVGRVAVDDPRLAFTAGGAPPCDGDGRREPSASTILLASVYTAIDCHCLGIHTAILPSLLPVSVR
jgi:hypothetical protein